MMSKEERTHRYAMMGVVAYIEECIHEYLKKEGVKPNLVILGALEWQGIMGCTNTEEWSVAGIPVIPDLTKQQSVELT